jgi:hypothetical protein
MTLQAVRSVIESKVSSAYQALNPPVEVVFDNTYETPPALPYVICLIGYTSTTETVICQAETAVENLQGNLQLSIYAPRGRGMGALELYAAEGMKVMNTLYDWTSSVRVRCGQVNGPVSLLNGPEPYALVTISCPFSATVDAEDSGSDPGGTFSLNTSQVALTNPTP